MSLRECESQMLAEFGQSVSLCKVGRILARLDEADRAFLDSRIGTHSSLYVTRLLARDGIAIGDATIRKHRFGSCACVTG